MPDIQLRPQKSDRLLGLARILADRLEEANKQVGVEFVSLTKNINFDPKVVGLVPQNILMQHKVVPIAYGTTR